MVNLLLFTSLYSFSTGSIINANVNRYNLETLPIPTVNVVSDHFLLLVGYVNLYNTHSNL